MSVKFTFRHIVTNEEVSIRHTVNTYQVQNALNDAMKLVPNVYWTNYDLIKTEIR